MKLLVTNIGDFYKRWPSLIEPYTKNVTKILENTDSEVKSASVTVISHLVLTKNLKDVRAISSMAFLHDDKEESVKVAVDLFFNELISTSGSEDELLQKVIPDVILLMNENVNKDKKLDKANYDNKLKENNVKFEKIVQYLAEKVSEQEEIGVKSRNANKL